MRLPRIAQVSLLTALVGCESAEPDPHFLGEVDSLAKDRTGVPFCVEHLLGTDPALPVDSPAGELSQEQAIDLALTHNLSLVASSETLNVAQAQLAQAGLLQNPTLGQTGAFLFPLSAAGGALSFDFQIEQVINGFFTRPYKESAAQAQRFQAGIDLARQAFELAQQVELKYEELIHLRRSRRLAERVADSYRQAVDAAEARAKVGVVPTSDVNRARIQFEDAQRQVRLHETRFRRAARELNWLMGAAAEPLWTLPDTDAQATEDLPTVPDPDQLEELGCTSRLDLLRADFDRKVADANVKLANAGLFPTLSLGFDVARDSNRNWAAGPSFNLELPIFDQGTVGVSLAHAQERLAQKTWIALQSQVRQEVRTALGNLRTSEDDVRFYRDRLIPQEEQNVALAEASFRLGNGDLDGLLNTLREYVGVLQSYEDAVDARQGDVVDLQRAVGLALSRIVEPKPFDPEPPR